MKSVLKMFKRLLLGLISLLLLYFLVALSLSWLPAPAEEQNCQLKHEVYITTNGVHLFLIVPRHYFSADFLTAVQAPEDARYLYLGWGEKTFYLNTPQWGDLTFPVAAKAMLWPSEGAMHVIYFWQKRAQWRKVELCSAQKQRLVKFVQESFSGQKGKYVRLPAKGFSEHDYFYPARGTYSLFNTSNTWVNQALKTAGQEAAWWTPFDFGVLWHVPEGN